MRNEEEERHKTQAQLPEGETLQQQNASSEQLNLHVNRRIMLKRAGMVLGASGALATLAIPAGATSEDHDVVEIVGLWQGVVSAQDNSFPSFKTFELYGGIWISSGQTDLKPAVLTNVHTLDVRHFDTLPSFIEDIVRDYGRLDVLVNNAGFAVAGFAEDFWWNRGHFRRHEKVVANFLKID
jgi:NAD(P)-dependent dehydrogenase (short-subunit alcohol dehydrogenase family)